MFQNYYAANIISMCLRKMTHGAIIFNSFIIAIKILIRMLKIGLKLNNNGKCLLEKKYYFSSQGWQRRVRGCIIIVRKSFMSSARADW